MGSLDGPLGLGHLGHSHWLFRGNEFKAPMRIHIGAAFFPTDLG